MKPHWLRSLKIERVALVDQGANQDAHVVLYKRKTKDVTMPEPVVDEEVRKTVADLTKKLADESAARVAAEKVATDLQKSVSEQAAAIAKMAAERRTADFIAKARTLPAFGKAEEFGPLLAKIEAALAPAEYAAVETRFKALNDQLGASNLLAELGVGGGEEGTTPTEKLNAMAKAHQKENKGTTFEAAYAAVIKTPEGSTLFRAATREGK